MNIRKSLIAISLLICSNFFAQNNIIFETVEKGEVSKSAVSQKNCIGFNFGPKELVAEKLKNRINYPTVIKLISFDLQNDIGSYFHALDLRHDRLIVVTDFKLNIDKINNKINGIGIGFSLFEKSTVNDSEFVYLCKMKSGTCSIEDAYDKYILPLEIILNEVEEQLKLNQSKINKENLTIELEKKKEDVAFLTEEIKSIKNKIDSIKTETPTTSFLEINFNSLLAQSININGVNCKLKNQKELNLTFFKRILNSKKGGIQLFTGLGLSNRNISATSSLGDSDFKIMLPKENSSGLDSKVVYYKKVTEHFSANQVSIIVPIEYRVKISERFLFSNSLKFNYCLPFKLSSELSSGNFSYRGNKTGINEELVNISSLDLIENVNYTSFSKSETKLKGYGFNVDFDLMYSARFFYLKGGINLSYFTLKNSSYIDDYKLSPSLKNYNSTFNNNSKLNLPAVGVQFCVGINLN